MMIFLHHFPYVGVRGKEDEEALVRMGERMRVVYEETFGGSDVRTIADNSAGPRNAYGSRDDARPAYCSRADCSIADDGAPAGPLTGQTPMREHSARYYADRPALATG
jgi:hypothetical protein